MKKNMISSLFKATSTLFIAILLFTSLSTILTVQAIQVKSLSDIQLKGDFTPLVLQRPENFEGQICNSCCPPSSQ